MSFGDDVKLKLKLKVEIEFGDLNKTYFGLKFSRTGCVEYFTTKYLVSNEFFLLFFTNIASNISP